MLAAWKLGYFDLKKPDKLNEAADRVRGTPWLRTIFVAVYAALATVAAPVSPLAYGAGAVFGVAQGSILVWIASIAGGAAGYWLARSVWADSAKRLLGRHQDKLGQLQRGNAFLTTVRLQILPVMPFGVFNYAAGTSRMSFVAFLGGTALGIVPATIAATYVGDRIAAGVRGSGKQAFVVAGVVVIALFGLSFLPNLIARIRRR